MALWGCGDKGYYIKLQMFNKLSLIPDVTIPLADFERELQELKQEAGIT